jgi:hypothetical protein
MVGDPIASLCSTVGLVGEENRWVMAGIGTHYLTVVRVAVPPRVAFG